MGQCIRLLSTDGVDYWGHRGILARRQLEAVRLRAGLAVQRHERDAVTGEADVQVTPRLHSQELVRSAYLGQLRDRRLVDEEQAHRSVFDILCRVEAYGIRLRGHRDK